MSKYVQIKNKTCSSKHLTLKKTLRFITEYIPAVRTITVYHKRCYDFLRLFTTLVTTVVMTFYDLLRKGVGLSLSI